MGKKKRFLSGCLALLLTFVLAACGEEEQTTEGSTYLIYYVNNQGTKIVSREYTTATLDREELFEELTAQLGTQSEKREYQAPLAKGFSVVSHLMDNGLLTMNFDEHYKNMQGPEEVLTRAAIVRTMTQLPDVEHVSFTIQGEPLTDSSGVTVGMMAADTFIENTGNEINSYEKVHLHLYFADESGAKLVEENQRNVVYNSNISMEKLVVEKLIEGPKSENVYPTINPETKIVSVTVKDGTCYVNLSSDFLTQPYNVTSDVTLYSITNSLVELPNINKVMISVNGETNISYREKVSLNQAFERNLDLLGTEEE